MRSTSSPCPAPDLEDVFAEDVRPVDASRVEPTPRGGRVTGARTRWCTYRAGRVNSSDSMAASTTGNCQTELALGLPVLVRVRRRSGATAWGEDLLAFEADYGAFARWTVMSKRWTWVNPAR